MTNSIGCSTLFPSVDHCKKENWQNQSNPKKCKWFGMVFIR